jgi:hypothetical protein
MKIIKAPRHFKIQIESQDGVREAKCYYIAELPIGRALKFFGLQKEYNAAQNDEIRQAGLMLDMFDYIIDGLTREEIGDMISYGDAMKILEEAAGNDKKKENSPTPISSSPDSAITAS